MHQLTTETAADTKEKPYPCSICGEAFTRQDLWSRHQRLKHSQAPGAKDTAPSQQLSNSLQVTPSEDVDAGAIEHDGSTYGQLSGEDLYTADGSFVDFTSFMDTVGLDFEVAMPDLIQPVPMMPGLDAVESVSPTSPRDERASLHKITSLHSRYAVPDIAKGEGTQPQDDLNSTG